jgi:hypothetical protein
LGEKILTSGARKTEKLEEKDRKREEEGKFEVQRVKKKQKGVK